MKPIACVCALGLALLAGGSRPAAAQNREHLQMAAELRMLQQQQQQFAIALAKLAEALAEATKAVNTRIDDTNSTWRKGLVDQNEALKSVGLDVNVIRERTQDTGTRIGTLGDEVDALRLAVASLPSLITRSVEALQAAMPAPLDAADPTAPVVASSPAPALAPGPAAPSTVGLSPTRLYDTAWADYTSGQYKLAISGFEQFVRTSATSERADDAQQLMGDALYALNQFVDAIAAYTIVIQNYPKGDQAPMAYYKRGLMQERLGQLDAARASWELAVKLYPESEGARLAGQGLTRVGRLTPSR